MTKTDIYDLVVATKIVGEIAGYIDGYSTITIKQHNKMPDKMLNNIHTHACKQMTRPVPLDVFWATVWFSNVTNIFVNKFENFEKYQYLLVFFFVYS